MVRSPRAKLVPWLTLNRIQVLLTIAIFGGGLCCSGAVLSAENAGGTPALQKRSSIGEIQNRQSKTRAEPFACHSELVRPPIANGSGRSEEAQGKLLEESRYLLLPLKNGQRTAPDFRVPVFCPLATRHLSPVTCHWFRQRTAFPNSDFLFFDLRFSGFRVLATCHLSLVTVF